jgi:hypothetical protein
MCYAVGEGGGGPFLDQDRLNKQRILQISTKRILKLNK